MSNTTSNTNGTTGAAAGLPLVASTAQLLQDAANLLCPLMLDPHDLSWCAARDEWLAEHQRWLVCMSEHEGITNAQELALRRLCERYGVVYDPTHYELRPFDLPAGYVCGWVGGPHHRNPRYATPVEPAGKPTIYVGVSAQGEVSS